MGKNATKKILVVHSPELGSPINTCDISGMATASVWGYIFKAWKLYAIALAVPTTIIIPICWYLYPESPRLAVASSTL